MFEECTMVEITPVNALLFVFVPCTAIMVLLIVCTSIRKHCRKCLVCLISEVVGEECGLGCIVETCGVEPEGADAESGPKVITRVTDMINETSPGGKHHIIHVTEAALATGLLCVKLPKNVRFVVHD